MAAIDKVKVLVVGDSGVGKSCLTHLIAHNEPISNPSWTVGCSVEVKLHEYKEGTINQKTYFIELWDVGGSNNHRNTRNVFYNGVHGIILAHDLTNRKSQENLRYWLSEILNKGSSSKSKQAFDELDTEQCAGTSMTPMLVVGTKLDLAGEKRLNVSDRNSFAHDCGADKIFLDCRDTRSLTPGSSSSVTLSRFFDKVIEMRYHRRDLRSPYSMDKRRTHSQLSSPVSPKLYHND